MRVLVIAVAVGFSCLVVISFLGALHPAGDSFAVFRVPITLIAMVAWTIAGIGRLMKLALMGAGAVILLLLVPGWLQSGSAFGETAKIYQKNLLFRAADRDEFLNDINSLRPDVITLQEVSEANRPLLKRLQADFPSQLYCRFGTVGGTAVLSQWPMVTGSETCAPGLSAIQVTAPDGPIWVISIHLHWPWPFRQAGHREALLPVIAGLEGRKLMGGDFNMVPWSHTLRRFQEVGGVKRAGRVTPTLWKKGVPLAIDHVLAPGGGRIDIRPKLGSDHLGVFAQVNLEAADGN